MSRLGCLDKFKSGFSMGVVVARLYSLGIEYLDLNKNQHLRKYVPISAGRT
jgi:hypothetical protein